MLASGLFARASRICLLRLLRRWSPRSIRFNSSPIPSDIVALHADLAGETLFTARGRKFGATRDGNFRAPEDSYVETTGQAYSRGRTTRLQGRGASARVRLTHPAL